MNSVLLWIGGLLVAALGLLFAVPYAIDWNSYRGVFEEEASRLLGRDVRVGGKVNLRLLPVPYVRFEKIRISDADATLGEPFFRAEAFTLWLSIMPLMRGAIEANEIELDRPVLRLAIGPDGRGNWQALKVVPGALTLTPSSFALQTLKIRNGAVSLKTQTMPEPVSLTGVSGELDASKLTGPYRFRGAIDWDGSPRELRVSTTEQDGDGRLRFKASVSAPASGNSYAFDGLLTEIGPKAQVEGTLTARLPIARLAAPAGERAAAVARPRQGVANANAFDLKSEVKGNLEALSLSDISVAYEQDGKPQLITGEANAAWRNGMVLRVALASRWLDLDRLADGGEAVRPLELLRDWIERVGGMLPAQVTTHVKLDVDQINLGGDAVSGFRIALVRVGGRTSIGELRASLPGSARANVRGTMGAGGDTRTFDGEIVLRGTSFQRFMAWANRAPATLPASVQGRGDGPFSLAAQLKMAPGRLELAGASVEFSESQLQGELDWRWGAKKELRVGIEGATLDVAALMPGALQLDAWLDRRDARSAGTDKARPHSPLAPLGAVAQAVGAAVGEMRVKVRASEVVDGARKLHDVEADLGLENGGLAIQSLKFATPQGVEVDVQGDLKGLEGKPTGRLRGWVRARGAAAVKSLSAALPAGQSLLAGDAMARVGKIDLGFSASVGGSRPDQLQVRANGTIDEGRIGLVLTLAGGISGWREAPVDLSLQIDSADLPHLFRRMGGLREIAGGRLGGQLGGEGAGGTLVLKTVGASAAALVSYAQLDLGGLGLTYAGRSGIATDGSVELGGDLSVVAGDAADLVALAGADYRAELGGLGVEGTLSLVRGGGRATLEARSLGIGSSRVSGTVAVSSRPAGGRTHIDAKLVASRISLAALIGIVLNGREPSSPAARQDGEAAAWSDAPFTFALLEGMEGRIALSTPVLEVAHGLEIAAADMLFELAPGRVALARLEGAALGGKVSVKSVLERPASNVGASLTLDSRIDGARLDQVAGAAPGDRDPGEAGATLSVAGRALSPRSIVSVLAGTGELVLRNARVRGLALGSIDAAARSLIEGTDDVTRAALETAVRTGFASAELPIGARRLPIQVADGILKVGVLQVDGADAIARNTTTLDLAALRFDSEWQVSPRRSLPLRPGGSVKAPLPPVSLVWTGALGNVAAVAPRLSIETLEREVLVRKMERDVERLEELRRRDEERRREEAERLRRLDDAAQGPGAAGQPQAPPVIQAPFIIRPGSPAAVPVVPPPAVDPRRQGALPGAAPEARP